MHVTCGTCYAILSFLYENAAAKIREENLRFLSEEESCTNPGRSSLQLQAHERNPPWSARYGAEAHASAAGRVWYDVNGADH